MRVVTCRQLSLSILAADVWSCQTTELLLLPVVVSVSVVAEVVVLLCSIHGWSLLHASITVTHRGEGMIHAVIHAKVDASADYIAKQHRIVSAYKSSKLKLRLSHNHTYFFVLK